MPSLNFQSESKKLHSDSSHGAVFLTLEVLRVLKEELQLSENIENDFKFTVEELMKVHPEMASIKNSLIKIRENLIAKKKEIIIRRIDEQARIVLDREIRTISNMSNYLLKYKSIMTISASSTILNALREIPDERRNKRIFVLESRPILEGQILAKELANLGYEVHIIVDAATGYFGEKVEAFVIGADTIFSDGSVINKVGSFLLALTANFYKKPFFVAASSNKISSMSSKEHKILIKHKPPQEIYKEKIKNLSPLNVYFDFVPAKYITKLISEK